MSQHPRIFRCFYRGQTVDFSGVGLTQLEARNMGAKHFKAKKPWDVTAILIHENGAPVTHSTASI